MLNKLQDFKAPAASQRTNPYAVDVIRAKRNDLVYGISHTEDLLDLLVAEGALTAAKRSVILTLRSQKDQNSRVLDILQARGERACRKFFHPCLVLAEPNLYQRIKTYVGSVNEHIQDTRRQLIGYLLEREKEGMDRFMDRKISQNYLKSTTKETKTFSPKNKSSISVPLEKPEDEPAQSQPEHLLHRIATNGDLLQLEELLEGTDINTVNSTNETLLHAAAEHGHLSVLELLIRKGARLDLQDLKGHTALHKATSKGHTEIVEALAKAGAPIYALDLQGKTPVHLAAESGGRPSVNVLVKEEAEQSRSLTQDMFLHRAAMEDDWRLAERLLQGGASLDATNHLKKTALFYAVARGSEKTVNVLLNAGAKVDVDVLDEALKLNHESVLRLVLAKARGALGDEALGSALLSAVRQNQGAVVTALIDNGANVNMCDQQGYTPLLLSAELGHAEVFSVLVAKQAKVDATLGDLSSAWHLAVHGGSVPIAETLLKTGLNPNVAGPKAQTPLHLAAQWNRSGFVGLLLKGGAQVNASAQDGLTPLHVASQRGHADAVRELLQAKADVRVKDRLGRTALHWAACSSEAESRVVDLLLSAKANPNATDSGKRTALHLAATGGRLDAVISLLSHKAKGGAKDMDGCTPLHYAAAEGHAGVVSALLQSLSNKGIEERNAWRKTPLHVAAEKGHDSVAALLLEAGAQVNATDQSKDTPLHCAARAGHLEVVKRFVGWGQDTGWSRKVNLQATNNLGKTPLQVAESGDTAEHENIATLLKRKMLLIK